MSEMKFTWIPFYTALADRLLDFRGNRVDLLLHIRKVYDDTGMKLPRLESDGNPVDIDPFTVFGLFNKGMKSKNRLAIAKGLAQELELDPSVLLSQSGFHKPLVYGGAGRCAGNVPSGSKADT